MCERLGIVPENTPVRLTAFYYEHELARALPFPCVFAHFKGWRNAEQDIPLSFDGFTIVGWEAWRAAA